MAYPLRTPKGIRLIKNVILQNDARNNITDRRLNRLAGGSRYGHCFYSIADRGLWHIGFPTQFVVTIWP